MIEIILKGYLDSEMNVPIYLENTENMPDSYILVEKTGSSLNNWINTATVAFQSYGTSMYEAAKLNEILKRKLLSSVKLDEIGSVKLNSDYNFTDTETKKYRYQAVFDFTY